MPRSVRIGPDLEKRLSEVAKREGVPVSAVVREAIEKHCDAVLGTGTRERLSYVIGAAEGRAGEPASQNGEGSSDIAAENHRNPAPSTDTIERLSYFIGMGEGSGEALGRRTGEAFADMLVEKYRRRQAARDPD